MPSLDEFRKQAIPVYLASEYWYCAAKIFHSKRLSEVSAKQKQIGKEMHELKATENLRSLKGILIPIKPESVEQLQNMMFRQVSKAITEKIILANSYETTLYYGVLSKLNCIGVPDAIDCTDGINPVVVERKFVKNIPAEPWLDHKIQVQIYMMTLQELGFLAVESRLEYWSADSKQLIRTFKQKLDDGLKEKAIRAIRETAQIVKGSNNLIPTKNPSKCKVCEYRVLCKWRADLKEYVPPYFLDIETNIQGTLIWCIGIFDSVEAKISQFFLEPEADESSILKDVVQLLSQRPASRILSFSGSAYERRILRKQLETNNIDKDVSRRILDVHPIICGKLKKKALRGLKTIAAKYGYKFKYDDMNGRKAASLYDDYKRNKRQSIKNKLLEYNKDDVMALGHLAMRIPDAFDSRPVVGKIEDEDRELLRRYYKFKSSYLRVEPRGEGGLNVELRFRCRSHKEICELSKILEKYGFNPRVGMNKNTEVIRMYGRGQVSDFLSILGENLDKIILSRYPESHSK